MDEKLKNKVVVISFLIIIYLFFLMNIFSEDKSISEAERRKLVQFTEPTVKNVINGDFFEGFEKYALDQFPLRDKFREAKVDIDFSLLKKKDYKEMFIYNGGIFEKEYPLNKKSLDNIINKWDKLYKEFLKENKVYYSIIPSKNYFIQKESGNLVLDYKEMINYVTENEKNMEYIDITDILTLDDYYKTDPHWKQEKIIKVANKIKLYMTGELSNNTSNQINTIKDFAGTYYSRLPKYAEKEEIKYITNKYTENSTVFNYETSETTEIYDLNKLSSIDKYDIFLSGATPLIEIENNNQDLKRELIIFRDSFGSSIAPLFLDKYKKITLIDTRYINPSILGNFVDFKNKDVLFLYSTLLINNSMSIK